MTESIRIEGDQATLLIDDEEIPPDAVVSWSAARVAAMIRGGYQAGHESGQTRVLDTIREHPELFASGAPSFEAAASGDADISLRETTLTRDANGKISGTVERLLTPPPRRRSTDRGRGEGNPR